MTSRTVLAALSTTALLLTAGCSVGSGGDDASAKADSSTSASATPTPSGSGSASPTLTDASGSAATTKELGEPVATRSSSSGDAKLTMAVFPLRRDGDLVQANFQLTADPANSGNFHVADNLSDDDSESGDRTAWTADGIRLIDPTAKKVHLPATDGAGNCLCSSGLLGLHVAPGNSVLITVTFAAPSSDTVSISAPGFGTFTGVPVE